MKAMALFRQNEPLRMIERPDPVAGPGQIALEVLSCGVCRTDLHIADGDLPIAHYPVIPGHEIVGRVIALGEDVAGYALGDRVGVPWLGHTCGTCRFCRAERENLYDVPHFTGWQLDGGYATHALAEPRYCFPIPSRYSDAQAAPLLCAGLIGHRSLKATGGARDIGIYGFGAAAHIVAQVAAAEGRRIYAFTRPGDQAAQQLARECGAVWAGGSDEKAPVELDAAIIFAAVGALVPLALKQLSKGGTLVLGGIHMSEIPAMPYEILWGERVIRSIANLTRDDGLEFMRVAERVPLKMSVTTFPLAEANDALQRLRDGELTGAAVLIP